MSKQQTSPQQEGPGRTGPAIKQRASLWSYNQGVTLRLFACWQCYVSLQMQCYWSQLLFTLADLDGQTHCVVVILMLGQSDATVSGQQARTANNEACHVTEQTLDFDS